MGVNKYDASKSSTSSLKSGPVSVSYQDDTKVSGPVYTDTGESLCIYTDDKQQVKWCSSDCGRCQGY
jgi:hypothetical protein